jgi:hypothetical protein
MKKRIVINNRRARLLAMSLALGAGMTITWRRNRRVGR